MIYYTRCQLAQLCVCSYTSTVWDSWCLRQVRINSIDDYYPEKQNI